MFNRTALEIIRKRKSLHIAAGLDSAAKRGTDA